MEHIACFVKLTVPSRLDVSPVRLHHSVALKQHWQHIATISGCDTGCPAVGEASRLHKDEADGDVREHGSSVGIGHQSWMVGAL